MILSAITVWSASLHAAVVIDPTAASETDTTVDGATVSTWESVATAADTTFTRTAGDARYVSDSDGGIPAIDLDRSAPFAGDFSAGNGAATIRDATIFAWANFDGYANHGTTSSSYYSSINGTGNEHTLGRDGNGGTDDLHPGTVTASRRERYSLSPPVGTCTSPASSVGRWSDRDHLRPGLILSATELLCRVRQTCQMTTAMSRMATPARCLSVRGRIPGVAWTVRFASSGCTIRFCRMRTSCWLLGILPKFLNRRLWCGW